MRRRLDESPDQKLEFQKCHQEDEEDELRSAAALGGQVDRPVRHARVSIVAIGAQQQRTRAEAVQAEAKRGAQERR